MSLDFAEVPNTFAGGQSFQIVEQVRADGAVRTDNSGDIIAVDPAVLSPEPSTLVTLAAGLAAIGLRRKRIHRTA